MKKYGVSVDLDGTKVEAYLLDSDRTLAFVLRNRQNRPNRLY